MKKYVDMFKRIEKKERNFRAGDIIKLDKEVSNNFFVFLDNRSIFYSFKTKGELGKIDRIFKVDISDTKMFNFNLDVLLKKILDFDGLPSQVKTSVEYRVKNNPNRKIYIIYFIFTFKDKMLEHYRQADTYGILVADEIIPANDIEKKIFLDREEKFVSMNVAEAI